MNAVHENTDGGQTAAGGLTLLYTNVTRNSLKRMSGGEKRIFEHPDNCLTFESQVFYLRTRK